MTLARKVAWGIIGLGVVAAFLGAFLAPGGMKHLPWIISFTTIIGISLGWNRKKDFAVFDAGEDVFIAVMVVFLTMFVWARIGF